MPPGFFCQINLICLSQLEGREIKCFSPTIKLPGRIQRVAGSQYSITEGAGSFADDEYLSGQGFRCLFHRRIGAGPHGKDHSTLAKDQPWF